MSEYVVIKSPVYYRALVVPMKGPRQYLNIIVFEISPFSKWLFLAINIL